MTTISTYQIVRETVIPTKVSCDISEGIGIKVEGLKDVTVKESLLRVVTALVSLGFRIPGKKLTVTVSPEIGSPSCSGILDSAIALAIIGAAHPERYIQEGCVIGELGLDGDTRYNQEQEKIILFHEDNCPDISRV